LRWLRRGFPLHAGFRLGLSCLWDEVEASEKGEERGTTGIAVFDQLRRLERRALVAQVAKGLHDEEESCLELTALTEGMIAAVFAHLRYLIGIELEMEAAGGAVAAVDAKVAGIFARLGTDALSWRARFVKLRTGRLFGRSADPSAQNGVRSPGGSSRVSLRDDA
jgi:hypothetical protein